MQTATTSPRPLSHPPWRAQPAHLRRIFREPQPVLDELRERYGPVVGGADHKRRRGSVQAAFSRRRLDGWIPLILDRTDAAIDRVAADGDHVRDLYVVGRELVLDLVVRVLFGGRMAHRTAEIGALFRGPQDYLEAPAIRQIPHPIPGTTRARVRADRKALDRIIDAEIAERRVRPSGDRLDVLEALVADGTLDDSEIRDQVVTLIGAGFDTTSRSEATGSPPGRSCSGPPTSPGVIPRRGTLIASRLAQRLDVEPTAEVEPRPVGMVVNRPVRGAPMRVRPRA